MLETVDQYLQTILGWFNIIPIEMWAVMAGLFIGGVVTQWVKRNFPMKILFPSLSKAKQVMCIRVLALLASFLPTYFIWPSNGGLRLWAAIAVGFGSPMVYRIATFFAYKKWPDLEARLSGTNS